MQKEWTYAEEYYHKLVVLHPEKQNFQYNLACAYHELGKYNDAIKILSQLVATNPKSVAMGQRLADCYEKTNNTELAKNVYTNLIKLGKIPAEVYYRYAPLCMKTEDRDKAENIFKKVIQLDPTNPYAHKDLGVVYLSERLFDYAKDEFETAYKMAPDDASVVFELANFHHAMNDFKQAQELYEKSIYIRTRCNGYSFIQSLELFKNE